MSVQKEFPWSGHIHVLDIVATNQETTTQQQSILSFIIKYEKSGVGLITFLLTCIEKFMGFKCFNQNIFRPKKIGNGNLLAHSLCVPALADTGMPNSRVFPMGEGSMATHSKLVLHQAYQRTTYRRGSDIS